MLILSHVVVGVSAAQTAPEIVSSILVAVNFLFKNPPLKFVRCRGNHKRIG